MANLCLSTSAWHQTSQRRRGGKEALRGVVWNGESGILESVHRKDSERPGWSRHRYLRVGMRTITAQGKGKQAPSPDEPVEFNSPRAGILTIYITHRVMYARRPLPTNGNAGLRPRTASGPHPSSEANLSSCSHYAARVQSDLRYLATAKSAEKRRPSVAQQ